MNMIWQLKKDNYYAMTIISMDMLGWLAPFSFLNKSLYLRSWLKDLNIWTHK